MRWNSLGTALLVLTATESDVTGSTYYGETGLHLLHADGSFSCTVPFNNNPGPVQDAQWSPTGRIFLVIQASRSPLQDAFDWPAP
jgi:translation initiation factor 2A